MGKNVSFDMIKKLLHNLALNLSIGEKDLKWIITLAAAFLTSIVACICSQPGDMILTASSATGKSFLNTLSDIYRNSGFGGFYVGTQARLAHVASIITIQLVVYDFMKTVLGLPASGSH
jgi:solute carrier family 25 phosphate transporter 3